jgi:hypothetical protein
MRSGPRVHRQVEAAMGVQFPDHRRGGRGLFAAWSVFAGPGGSAFSLGPKDSEPRGEIMPRLRSITAAAFALTLAGAMTVAAAPANAVPQASPPCFGPTCVGRDPNLGNSAGRCVDYSRQIAYVYSPISDPAHGAVDEKVALIFSDWCGSNWAKLLQVANFDAAYTRYWVQSYDKHQEYGSGGWYSPMVDGVQLARACAMDQSGSFENAYKCTLWH